MKPLGKAGDNSRYTNRPFALVLYKAETFLSENVFSYVRKMLFLFARSS